MRIVPAYWVILLLTALVLQSARIHQGGGAGIGAITDPLLLVQNLLLIQNYDGDSLSTGISPAWSLAVEVVFYLVLPILVIGAIRLARRTTSRAGRRKALLVPAAVLGIVGVLSIALGPRGAEQSTGAAIWNVSFLARAHLFALGLGLAVLWVEYQDGLLHLPRWWRPAAAAAMIAIAVTTIALAAADAIPETFEVAFIAFPCALLLALTDVPVKQPHRVGLARSLDAPALVGAGLISYSVYLWHMPVLLWLRDHDVTLEGGVGEFLVNLAVIAGATALLSWLTYRYVEKPAMRRKSSRRSDPTSHAEIPQRRDRRDNSQPEAKRLVP